MSENKQAPMHSINLNSELQKLQKKLAVLREEGCIVLQHGDRGFASAPANIALIKYWGKENNQIPQNSSVSLTLGGFRAFTSVQVRGRFFPNDESNPRPIGSWQALLPGCDTWEKPPPRMEIWLQTLFHSWAPEIRLRIESENNFPTACGVASSAAGFAALTGAIADLLQLHKHFSNEELNLWLTEWSRLGSGSATRSALLTDATPFVAWERQSCTASATYPVEVHSSLRELQHCLVVLDTQPKRVSSTAGHSAALSSPFHTLRLGAIPHTFAATLAALKSGDFDTLAGNSEADATAIHAIMHTSEPASRHLTEQNAALLAKFMHQRNQAGVAAFWTMDAGPNIHLLFLPAAAPFVRAFLEEQLQETKAGILWSHSRLPLQLGRWTESMRDLPNANLSQLATGRENLT